MSKQRILLTAGEDIIIRNILFTDVLPELMKEADVVVACEPKRLEYLTRALPGVRVVPYERGPRRFLEKVIGAFLHKGIATETVRWYTWHWVTRKEKALWYGVFERACHEVIGRARPLQALLVRLFALVAHDAPAEALLREVSPHAVVALSLSHFHFDVPLTLAGKRLGIRTVGMMRSWDNLVTHGLIRVLPDAFIFQNEYLRQTARRYQPFPERLLRGEAVGLPHYDFAQRGEIFSREETCAHFGLDPAKRTVLYAAMGDSFRYEAAMLPIFDSLMGEKKFPLDVQFLYRPHPTTSIMGRKELTAPAHVIVDKTVGFVALSDPAKDREGRQARLLFSLIAHVDVVLTTGSTFALDAATRDKPTLCLDFDPPGTNPPYWLSVKRIYDHFTHFIAYLKTGACEMVPSPEALPGAVTEALAHPEARRNERQRAIDLFFAPYDGRSGERFARRLLADARKPEAGRAEL